MNYHGKHQKVVAMFNALIILDDEVKVSMKEYSVICLDIKTKERKVAEMKEKLSNLEEAYAECSHNLKTEHAKNLLSSKEKSEDELTYTEVQLVRSYKKEIEFDLITKRKETFIKCSVLFGFNMNELMDAMNAMNLD